MSLCLPGCDFVPARGKSGAHVQTNRRRTQVPAHLAKPSNSICRSCFDVCFMLRACVLSNSAREIARSALNYCNSGTELENGSFYEITRSRERFRQSQRADGGGPLHSRVSRLGHQIEKERKRLSMLRKICHVPCTGVGNARACQRGWFSTCPFGWAAGPTGEGGGSNPITKSRNLSNLIRWWSEVLPSCAVYLSLDTISKEILSFGQHAYTRLNLGACSPRRWG